MGANRAAEQVIEDLHYISNPRLWVGFVCPVRRCIKGSRIEVAYLIGDGPNLYHGNMFAPAPEDLREEFTDFVDIINTGWRVD